jgi:hypothetical protein
VARSFISARSATVHNHGGGTVTEVLLFSKSVSWNQTKHIICQVASHVRDVKSTKRIFPTVVVTLLLVV